MTNNLSGLSRSNAYIRSRQFNPTSNFSKLGQELNTKVRNWIITGEGQPFAEVESCDIRLALTCIEDINKLSIDDYKCYLNYLFTLDNIEPN